MRASRLLLHLALILGALMMIVPSFAFAAAPQPPPKPSPAARENPFLSPSRLPFQAHLRAATFGPGCTNPTAIKNPA